MPSPCGAVTGSSSGISQEIALTLADKVASLDVEWKDSAHGRARREPNSDMFLQGEEAGATPRDARELVQEDGEEGARHGRFQAVTFLRL
jgi:NAD(P)-dependent dehydrogenase (short-subunit alcohol dehydrogenase family)